MSDRTFVVSVSRQAKAPPYLAALEAIGVAADRLTVVFPGAAEAREPAALAARAAGVLLAGGPDLEPRRYGEEPREEANLALLPERDEIEWQLLSGARDAATPVFGVCRGLQVINAFLGGTLWQDLTLQWPESVLHDLSFPRDALVHDVRIRAQGHPLARALGGEAPVVNSRHHQAIRHLAPRLEPVAWAPDGVIEAAALDDARWWVWGVQWHPENLVPLSSQRALWAAFRRAAEARSGTVPSVVARGAVVAEDAAGGGTGDGSRGTRRSS